MWGVAAIGASDNVATGTGGTARASVAGGTAIAQSGAECEVVINVAKAVLEQWALSLRPHKLALENLSSTPDSAERVAVNNEEGRAGGGNAAAPGADLLSERFVDAFAGNIRRSRFVG